MELETFLGPHLENVTGTDTLLPASVYSLPLASILQFWVHTPEPPHFPARKIYKLTGNLISLFIDNAKQHFSILKYTVNNQ